jgi:PAS domain S-box-containing protein
MILLDMRTVIFSYVLTNIACMLVMVLLWLQNRERFAGMTFLLFYYALQTFALFLLIMRGIIPDWASIILAHTLILTGVLLGYMGLLKFTGGKSPQIQNYILLILTVFIDSYFTYIKPDLAARYINISAGLLIIHFQCAWSMIYRSPAASRLLTRNISIVFGAFCLINIISIVAFSAGKQARSEFLQYGAFDTLIIISYQILFILLTYSLVLMFNKRLHMEISTQEEKFSKAFRSSPYALIITRLSDGKIIEINDSFMNITGYEYDDVSGKTSLNLNLWDKDEDRTVMIDELLKSGKVRNREFRFRKKSGEKMEGLFSTEIITINNETCILSSIDDITARKRAEEALLKSKETIEESDRAKAILLYKLDQAQQIAGIGSWDWDLINNTVWWSDETYRIFGVKPQEFTPGFEANTAFIHPDDLESYRKNFSHSLKTGTPLDYNVRIIRKDGGTIHCNAKGNVEQDDAGEPIRFIGTLMDITENNMAEDKIRILNEELEKKVSKQTLDLQNNQMALLNLVDDLNESAKKISAANRSLEAINKELTTFSYSASHDLRAPLRSIDGFSNILLEDYSDKLDDMGKNYLERIRRATQHMGQLIDDMLNLSRVTQSEFFLHDFNLSIMVRNIAYKNQQEGSLENLVLDIQEDVVVLADQRLMNIALTNLLDNAFKFTGKTKHPRIQFGADSINGETVIFVRDNGVGFDMACAGKLFGAFQRLHRADEFPGTGIGLATVQRIINRHGGRIWAESEPGKGATFFFTIQEKV